jgi:hypothetical protein
MRTPACHLAAAQQLRGAAQIPEPAVGAAADEHDIHRAVAQGFAGLSNPM